MFKKMLNEAAIREWFQASVIIFTTPETLLNRILIFFMHDKHDASHRANKPTFQK